MIGLPPASVLSWKNGWASETELGSFYKRVPTMVANGTPWDILRTCSSDDTIVPLLSSMFVAHPSNVSVTLGHLAIRKQTRDIPALRHQFRRTL